VAREDTSHGGKLNQKIDVFNLTSIIYSKQNFFLYGKSVFKFLVYIMFFTENVSY